MNTPLANRWLDQPLGTGGDLRRRFLLHHVPLALASAVVLALFMSLPLFDAHAYPHADIVSGTFPQERREGAATGHAGGQTGRTDHDGNQDGPMGHGGDQAGRHSGTHTGATGHGRDQPEAVAGSGDHAAPIRHSGRKRRAVRHPGEAGTTGTPGDHGGETAPRDDGADLSLTRGMQQFTVATGYLGLGLLAVTLLLGPAHLLLRRRNPVSSYLRRDVGAWTAICSVVHVICAGLIHVSHGRGLVSSFVHFFVAEDGSALTNSFGLGNWTGLAALVIVLGLLAASSDSALRKLKARPWKWLQRLNYALFALVILHAFFYGALLRMTSPFTLLLILSVMVVFVGQAVGVWLWRRRYAGIAASVP
jgi:sulfoxide reductase heme-binding subunit YedZ